MLIGITTPDFFEEEIHQILFWLENGIDILHIRKPNASEKEVEDFITSIPISYHNKITLHQYHHLVERFDLGGVHFRESDRRSTDKDVFNYWIEKKVRISSSVHDFDELSYLPNKFDYLFLSPVFDSISKEGYQANSSILKKMKENIISTQKIIALGGISPQTILSLKGSSFKGVALLGYLWATSSDQLISKAEQLLSSWKTIDLLP
ncbi:thiamine phosphate synthase [Flammeovirga agarivorans]|uniref:Thiamine phosphate synthase n=1 Tax=Flammeovirga agarivorans TaxID=2726742 RepID=A0A7X8SMX0_9BACT|nr:thiamine phosphate synthase [Flammeovirga agarivorans]NLR93150.1 thiamine phosphate synthase [Flammeovirga agarivorans]